MRSTTTPTLHKNRNVRIAQLLPTASGYMSKLQAILLGHGDSGIYWIRSSLTLVASTFCLKDNVILRAAAPPSQSSARRWKAKPLKATTSI
jgi:hypothetical protein